MRDLRDEDLGRVSGGVGDIVYHDNRDQLKWGNNGFGNGADRQNIAPGKSGDHGFGKRDSRGDDRGPR